MTMKTEGHTHTMLPLSSLRLGDTNPRVAIDAPTVDDYAEDLGRGDEFPPVVAFFDGSTHHLADGVHRFHAHKQAGRKFIACDVRPGGVDDARLYAAGANHGRGHGLRRSNADKRRAIYLLLTHPDARSWGVREMARWTHTSDSLVKAVKAGLAQPEPPAKRPTPDVATTFGTPAPSRADEWLDDEDIVALKARLERTLKKVCRLCDRLGLTAEEALANFRAAHLAKNPPPKPDLTLVVDPEEPGRLTAQDVWGDPPPNKKINTAMRARMRG